MSVFGQWCSSRLQLSVRPNFSTRRASEALLHLSETFSVIFPYVCLYYEFISMP